MLVDYLDSGLSEFLSKEFYVTVVSQILPEYLCYIGYILFHYIYLLKPQEFLKIPHPFRTPQTPKQWQNVDFVLY